MSPYVRAVTLPRGQSTEQHVAFCGGIIKGLNDNPPYTNPTIDMNTLQAAVDDLNAALAAQPDGGMAATAEKKNAAGGSGFVDAQTEAMRQAVQKCIEGLTEPKRRNHYDQAASLAAASVAVDNSSTTSAWFSSIQSEFLCPSRKYWRQAP